MTKKKEDAGLTNAIKFLADPPSNRILALLPLMGQQEAWGWGSSARHHVIKDKIDPLSCQFLSLLLSNKA